MQAAIRLGGLQELGECMASLKMIFASNLRRLLREKDLKSKDFAKRLGISPSNVTHWRNADKFPSPENIEKVCHILGVSYSELFREDTDPSPAGQIKPEDILKALATAFNYEVKKKGPPEN